MTDLAAEYRQLIAAGCSERLASAIVDTQVLPYDDWAEVHAIDDQGREFRMVTPDNGIPPFRLYGPSSPAAVVNALARYLTDTGGP